MDAPINFPDTLQNVNIDCTLLMGNWFLRLGWHGTKQKCMQTQVQHENDVAKQSSGAVGHIPSKFTYVCL